MFSGSGTAATACRVPRIDRQLSLFLLAREITGRTVASYRADQDSRNGLMQYPDFRAAFEEGKRRIRAMDYRFVEERDQNRQALLEIYAAVVLKTPYNDFGTH